MGKKNFVFGAIFFIFNTICSLAQSTTMIWTERPGLKHHFYEINLLDSGTVVFNGMVKSTAVTLPQHAKIYLFKDNVPVDTFTQPLTFTGDSAGVTMQVKIHGEIASYKTLFTVGAYAYTADSIIAGISILCNGQSNMVAGPAQMGGLNPYIPKDPYVVSYGNPSIPNSPPGMNFNLANPNTNYNNHSAGNLAFTLAKAIKDTLKMPVCVLNGAYSGTALLAHLRNDILPDDINTLYGRLLFRCQKAKISKPVAYFWFQGESDAPSPYQYDSLFTEFCTDLAMDYGFKMPVLLVQIHREACNANQDSVLSLQNTMISLAGTLPQIGGIIASNGLDLRWDNCHYNANGYISAGKHLANTFLMVASAMNPYEELIPKPEKITGKTGERWIKIKTSAPIDTMSLAGCKPFFRVRKVLPNQSFQYIMIDSLKAKNDTILLKINNIIDPGEVFEVAYLGSHVNTDTLTIKSLKGGALLSFSRLIDCLYSDSSLYISESCGFYSINGINYYSSGIFSQHFTASNGCDSVLYIHLTLTPLNTTLNQVACHSYILNGQNYTSSGIYYQAFTTASGCDSLITLNLTITNPDTTVIQTGGQLYSGAINASYQWIECTNGNQPVPGAVGQTFTPSGSGTYAVIVTQNGCIDTSACILLTNVGATDFSLYPKVRIFPNPVKNHLQITLNDFNPEVNLEIRNLLNEVVYKSQYSDTDELKVNLSLTPGIYTIKLTTGGLSQYFIQIVE
ncbi:MAG: T9SS type A sorting domain-containing protein [Bacteroidia bacterium]|nr:T9SS type A sorting domain-containing protein [Bacteroidia bacterium]